MLVLGIETSCDETAAAVVRDGRRLLSSVVSSQVELHARYGGVVPELASRQHVEAIIPVLDEALAQAGCSLADIDAVAVTTGPGLAGALIVGANAAKAMAYALDLPLVAVNHLEGHIYAAWLQEAPAPRFPGGPAVERLAAGAAPAIRLPRARLARPYDFSFSGLKTKVLRLVRGEEGPAPAPPELAAALPDARLHALVTK